MGILENVRFGHIAAEEEANNLQSYFLETPEYHSIAQDTNKILVVGRKGSGKSAIYVALRNRYQQQRGSVVEGLTFRNYPWTLHGRVKDESGSAERAYLNTWKFLILVTLAKRLVRFNEPQTYRFVDPLWWRKLFNANLRLVERFLYQNYGTIAPTVPEILIDRAKNIRKLNIQQFGVEVPEDSDDAHRLVKSINVVNAELERIIFTLLPRGGAPWFLLFDELDLGWDGSEDFKNSMTGLILSVRDLVRVARERGIPLHIVVFLRSDIYDTLRFQDKNKISPDVVSLVWEDSKLKDLVDARLRATGNNWDEAFSGDRMRQRLTQFKYIVRRTMLRPRDMIQYCLLAREEALNGKAGSITNEHVYAAEPKYSTYMRNELRDENYAGNPVVEKLLGVIQNEISTEKFDPEMFRQAIAKQTPNIGIDADQAMKLLIELSILGVKKVGGKGGGSTITYRYMESPETRLEPVEILTVHPSLRRTLNLRETRTQKEDEDE